MKKILILSLHCYLLIQQIKVMILLLKLPRIPKNCSSSFKIIIFFHFEVAEYRCVSILILTTFT